MNNKQHIEPDMVANNLTPAYPTHPGEIIKAELKSRGISQRRLAEHIGIAYQALSEILNGSRPVTAKTALLFEATLGINAEPLLQLQMRYNIQIAKHDESFLKKLEGIKRIVAVF